MIEALYDKIEIASYNAGILEAFFKRSTVFTAVTISETLYDIIVPGIKSLGLSINLIIFSSVQRKSEFLKAVLYRKFGSLPDFREKILYNEGAI